jgi:glycerol-3-phosphate acyltransferase PlsX
MPITIAVDAMGGDHGPRVTVAASLRFLEETPDAAVILVGLDAPVRAALAAARSAATARIGVRPATEVVEMHEPPADALRRKRIRRCVSRSIWSRRDRAGVRLGRQHRALMAISLRAQTCRDRSPGDRFYPLPTRTGATTALDLGANVNCTPEQLPQFAAGMRWSPRSTASSASVGLLNIGEEDIKATMSKQAGELLKVSGLNFYGNVRATISTGRPTYRVRWLCRQCGAENLGGPGNARRLPPRGIHAQRRAQGPGAVRAPHFEGVQASRGPTPL